MVCIGTETFSFILGLTENCDALLTATLTLHSADTSHEGSRGGQHPTCHGVLGATLSSIQEGLEQGEKKKKKNEEEKNPPLCEKQTDVMLLMAILRSLSFFFCCLFLF